MLFNSLQFLVFFMVVTLWFYSLQTQKSRNLLLLVASCYFYMSFVPKYILILGFTIVIDYLAGIQIARATGKSRRWWLILSIIANVGILAYYKYANFIIDNLNGLLHLSSSSQGFDALDIILPVGLSFHTFQAMSYTIEVYRGNQHPERNFATYALYVMFYPQLVAGPIERPQNILPQLHTFSNYNWDNIKEGITRMLWGFFKKVVIADRLAMVVDYCFDNTATASWYVLAIGAVFYSFQIYCDFSGYCDIGIGAAKVMNIRLMENFSQPYTAVNITTFWQRWHISLSSWFRDYVYIPLGGNRKGAFRRRINVFIVFLLSGLWHGANWTFVLWGGLHGLLVTIFPSNNKQTTRTNHIIKAIITFIAATLLWIFFRASNTGQATDYIANIFTLQKGSNALGINIVELVLSILLIATLLITEYRRKNHLISSNKVFYVYAVLMAAICYWLGVFGENQFIYFRF
ncbi:membrane-bound O-acyltransferase family protein [Chitinophagaceae bacterium IBVUCB1]|nr:membrane-bound O-acyltransferase family protein [Chitinophagaceae bacterium IBVUCB1]